MAQSVKRAQKEALYLRTIANLFREAAAEDSNLRGISVERVQISPDGSMCTVFFFMTDTHSVEEKINYLKLYKPSLRRAFAKELNQRRTPDFIFKYDKQFAKAERINQLLDSLHITDIPDDQSSDE